MSAPARATYTQTLAKLQTLYPPAEVLEKARELEEFDVFPGGAAPDDTSARLDRIEAKLDELLALERSRQLREDYERLTAQFRARLEVRRG